MNHRATQPLNRNRSIPCACGCGQSGPAGRMTTVRPKYSAEIAGRTVTRPGRSFAVLPSCAHAFEEELIHEAALQELTDRYAAAGWWRRMWQWHRIHDLTRTIHARRKGPVEASKLAARATRMWLLPRWVSLRLMMREIAKRKGESK